MNNLFEKFEFQIEQPSTEDFFVGQGHTNTANAIKNVILEHDNVHIIGLEGSLGAGKSTVINLIKDKLDDEVHHFVYFDLDQHHHGSTKATFIKVFSESLKNLGADVDCDAIDSAKNKALGNTLSYSKETESRISYFIVAFFFSLALGVKLLPDALVITFLTIKSIIDFDFSFSVSAFVKSALGYSPFIILLMMFFNGKIKKWRIPSVGDLLKRNGVDKITETLDITREVGSFELQEAFSSFIGTIPNGKVIILVIDNLDRLNSNKTREVWSDLDVFTSSCTPKCRILLPFSERHVAKALKDDEEDLRSGYEYISKRLPVVFRTPPIVTSGWKEKLEDTYWSTTLPNVPGVEFCCQLIEVWEAGKGDITPRFLKKHVNDIACFMVSNPVSDIPSVCFSAYLLSVKYNEVPFQLLLMENIKDDINGESNVFFEKIKSTHAIIKKLMSFDDWSSYLACIHYQTTKNIAISSLLIEPIKISISTCDSDRIIELSQVYGFDFYFNDLINSIDSINVLKLLARVAESRGSMAVEWLNKWIQKVNHHSKLEGVIKDYDSEYIKAFRVINASGLNVEPDMSRVKVTIKAMEGELCNKQDEVDLNIIKQLYDYCLLVEHKPKFIRRPSPLLFLNVLWPNRSELKSWRVDKSVFDNEYKGKLLFSALELASTNELSSPDFFGWFNSKANIGDLGKSQEYIKSLNFNASLDMINISAYVDSIPFDHKFTSLGYTVSLLNFYHGYSSSKSDSDEFKRVIPKLVAVIFSQSIISGSINKNVTVNFQPGNTFNVWGYIKQQLIKFSNYIEFFTNYIVYVSSLQSLVESSINSTYGEYVVGALKDIIKNERFDALHVEYFINEGYDKIHSLLPPDERRIFIETISQYPLKRFGVDDFSIHLIMDAIDDRNGVEQLSSLLKNKCVNNDFTSEKWMECIVSPSDNLSIILGWMRDNKVMITKCGNISNALKNIIGHITDFSNFERHDFIEKLMLCMPESSRKSISRKYEDRLRADGCSVDERIAIIRNFYNYISLSPSNVDVNIQSDITLIEHAQEPVVIDWLNSQNWNFKSWPRELLADLKEVLNDKVEEGVDVSWMLSMTNEIIQD